MSKRFHAVEKGLRLGTELPAPLLNAEHLRSAINAQDRFAKWRYEHECKWKPLRKVEEAIVAAIFKAIVTKL